MAARWVHASIEAGGEAFRTHSLFIQYNALAGIVGLSLFPLFLIVDQQVTVIDLSIFAVLAAPLILAMLVSVTGQLELGKRAGLACMASLLACLVAYCGGPVSAVAVVFGILPLEAVLWRCKRPVLLAGLLIMAAGVVAAFMAPVFTDQPTGEFATFDFNSPAWWVGLVLIYSMSVASRIQHRHNVLRAALSQECRRANLFSNHSGELLTRHAASGSTLFASSSARELLGTSPRDLLGDGLLNRVHLQDRVILLKSFSDTIQNGRQEISRIRVRVTGNKRRLWKWIEARSLANANDTTGRVEVVSALRDVSAEFELEERLEQTEVSTEELNDAQRRILAIMSHELRTPLNAIVGFSDILHKELFGKLPHARNREYVELIQQSSQHLLNVVNGMLDMSKIEAGKYELTICEFSLLDVSRSTVDMLRPMAIQGNVDVTIRIDQSLPDITADKRACQQILINLLSNAIKFSPEGGKVELSVRQFGRSLKIRISDDGIGIEEDFLSSVGQPFAQADSGHHRKYEGSGLGISVVKGLVALHDGEFDIKSTKGKGTTVSVILPMVSTSSRPVPSDNVAQLVHLDSNTVPPTMPQSATVNISKGDHRARVSA